MVLNMPITCLSANTSCFWVSDMDILKVLYEYFPTAVYTGKCIVFVSEDWRVELTEHTNTDFSKVGDSLPVVRIKIFKKALNGEFVAGHYEDFQLDSISELSTQIERYIQFAVGANVRGNYQGPFESH